ncbi:PEP-CTERM sorting domain-containing protein [Sphingoaurantiacus capsulatus]|uniref:PEP-CTERM sorting domain-containing protein n=1 Tax=Sphingoaurantiacus capsulatus TaxID=1771310 RepID=A0ABV7X7A8_9SPHN
MKKLLVAVLLAASAVPAAAAPFMFTRTFASSTSLPSYETAGPLTISGTFDGDANGNLITNISNVTLSIGGVAVAAPIYTAHLNEDNSAWISGGATLSFDGTANNALFIDVDFPNNLNYGAFFYSINAVNMDYTLNPFSIASEQLENGASSLQITAMNAEVPEPAMLGLFGLSAIGLGLGRRRRRA